MSDFDEEWESHKPEDEPVYDSAGCVGYITGGIEIILWITLLVMIPPLGIIMLLIYFFPSNRRS